MASRPVLVVLAAVAVLAAGSFAWIYSGHLTYGDAPPIRSDGAGYYVYLPALFIDHDLTLRSTGKREYGSPKLIPGVRVWPPRPTVYLNQFGIGVAVLSAPFFFAATALAAVTGAHDDGYSWPYQALIAAGGCVYVLLGLWLLASVLQQFFDRRTVAVTVGGIALGGAVIEYATYDATLSHGFSFCLCALVLRLTLALWQRPRVAVAVALGAAIGLVGLVRLTNLTIVLVPALAGVRRPADLVQRARALPRALPLVAAGVLACLVVLLPQFLYWHWLTGQFFVNSYLASHVHLDLLRPHFLEVLFSVRKGFIYWTPMLLIAIVGLPLLRRAVPLLFVPAIAYLVVQTWIVASWSQWWYGGSYGMRPLIDELPVFALGLAAAVSAAAHSTALARRALTAAVVVTTLLTVHGIVAYWLKTIPYDGTTARQYLRSFVHY